jgi:hypothetical protein
MNVGDCLWTFRVKNTRQRNGSRQRTGDDSSDPTVSFPRVIYAGGWKSHLKPMHAPLPYTSLNVVQFLLRNRVREMAVRK